MRHRGLPKSPMMRHHVALPIGVLLPIRTVSPCIVQFMGINDRPYYADEPPAGLAPSWNNRSLVVRIILINVGLYIANLVFSDSSDAVTKSLVLSSDHMTQPYMWWRLLTYGFAHDPNSIFHILFNMFSLYSLGRSVEERYGQLEFLYIYVLSIIVGGLAFWVTNFGSPSILLGASGAVCCVIMLFVFNYPKVPLSIWGVIEVPAWVIGVLLVIGNLLTGAESGNLGTSEKAPRVANEVHLAGIAFAAAYFYGKVNFTAWLPFGNWRRWQRRITGPRLKVHQPASQSRDDLEADRILQKIHEQGQDSLSKSEKKFMQKYSRSVRARRSIDSES